MTNITNIVIDENGYWYEENAKTANLEAPEFFLPIDFSASHNTRLQSINSQYPEGNNLILGDVPFNIPTGGNNIWRAELIGSNPQMIEIKVDAFGVSEIHTLINTWWGQPGPNSYASLEFFGSDGAYFKKDLIGNEDIRDYAQSIWTNNINGTTTTEVVRIQPGSYGSHDRLDKQQIELPADFADEILETVRVNDNGATNFQRVFLSGVTALTDKNNIIGTSGKDTLTGTAEDDFISGKENNDNLQGANGKDTIYGGSGNDLLSGGAGADYLLGGTGKNNLNGGGGNDTLVGVDPQAASPGRALVDTLTGGLGADKFVLGDENKIYYNDGNNDDLGFGDYALIKDFKATQNDVIELKGSAANYLLGTFSVGTTKSTLILLNTSGEDELIGFVKGVTGLNLNSSAFNFV